MLLRYLTSNDATRYSQFNTRTSKPVDPSQGPWVSSSEANQHFVWDITVSPFSTEKDSVYGDLNDSNLEADTFGIP